MKKLEFVLPKSSMGASCYRRSDLLKIYIYGYLERIRSSRRLEKECQRNDEMRWLICDLKPDHKTISDFRKNNHKALKNLFKNFLKLCKKLKLIDYAFIAVDGTKIHAQNSSNNVYKRNTIQYVEKNLDEKIESYFRDLDKQDEYEDKNDISVLPNKKNIDRLKKLKTQWMKQGKRLQSKTGGFRLKARFFRCFLAIKKAANSLLHQPKPYYIRSKALLHQRCNRKLEHQAG